ncbi:Glutathione S-transferase theta-3 [Bagarius yarrelli]|uniref:glutathione transferase n=1 Tax=Bagarius yarrelli TaxID=175774 RepID=A0A556TUD1_BAGYA|nr:Glutathione S-transferase theta-3 [Bagarius yarrelli]
MVLEIYLDLFSQPCRSVYIFAKKNNIPFEYKKLSLMAGEHYGEEFGKINMMRKVPAIRDGDFCLGERRDGFPPGVARRDGFPPGVARRDGFPPGVARRDGFPPGVARREADGFPTERAVSIRIAIMQYLVEKYGTPDHWYPADVQKRARVNEYLAWQHSAMRPHGSKILWLKLMIPTVMGVEVPKEKMDAALEDLDGSLKLVEEKFIQDRPFIAGEEISLADLVAIVEIMQPVGAGVDVFNGRPKLSAWKERVRAAIGAELFDEAHQGILSAQEMAKSMDGSTLQHFKARILKMFL